jgi:hypothetical protein
MKRPPPTITIPELAAVPELAVLAALLAVLDVIDRALLAAHPELADHERPYWILTPAVVPRAASVLRNADSLRRAVARYRLALTHHSATNEPPAGDAEIPF